MREIEFSSMLDIDSPPGVGNQFFAPLTQQFIKVNWHYISWDEAWNQLVQIGLRAKGPDVSELGTTWLGSFYAMEALRPFSMAEVNAMGGAQSFIPAVWRACRVVDSMVLGIPWILDMRMVLYRRDCLQRAGVDENIAFIDADHFLETLQCLRAAGHTAPLGLTTSRSVTRLIHDMSSWIWSAGGDIRSTNGRQMLLREPESRAGMEGYFALKEFIRPELQHLSEYDVIENFVQGKTAIAVVSDRTYYRIIGRAIDAVPEVRENIGLATLMQAPFIGGSTLAVWRHSAAAEQAVRLVTHLLSAEAGQILYDQCWALSAHQETIETTALRHDPYYPVIQQSLQKGRSVHNSIRWGVVEARLVPVIEQTWIDLFSNPSLNIRQEVEKRFGELSERLEQTVLAAYS